MKPHKHAELIKAWADGAEIEALMDVLGGVWIPASRPTWVADAQYRIKPEAKTNTFMYSMVGTQGTSSWNYTRFPNDNIKATFDGETGELKSVEML